MAEIRHLDNREKAIISTKNHPILIKIWYTNVDLELGNSHVTKYENLKKFKMADSRHIKNRFFCHNQ